MYKGSLFERLTHKKFNYSNDVEVLYSSISNNLSKIFSTNAGSSETVLDYGKPDLNNINLSLKESIEKIEINCEDCIKKYEPRLLKTKVNILRESLKMNKMEILIEGYLIVNGNAKLSYFKTNLLNVEKVKFYKDI
ncbi:MAG: type VI secretion system baseplate subunit TssE [Arcobacter sp.]|jgi:type VI secretion system protein|uniref:Type VI secretion system, baseplate protein n=1 Tax=Arcobacter defluvii TaxID=873191 RepID=A0AAE7BFD0_9BACT|nr:MULTISPECIES: type VI secretion system baseplate subunit TssE [Arcobacter]MDY0051157.1 type VI secretion system baseplate subunit TssE [Aliarcobacter sp.]QKF78266.1 type VI secretion system, baseplate protein [Arcobacter defluvii]RXI29073.1 type VI secretion system baseplate subunit TssE [Arcobacter defluvii]BAK74063.1 hypothetical protein ABLL_2188 [Arcobacter sp. L]